MLRPVPVPRKACRKPIGPVKPIKRSIERRVRSAQIGRHCQRVMKLGETGSRMVGARHVKAYQAELQHPKALKEL
jgi:hypothetical protein